MQEDDVQAMLTNPFYCIICAPVFTEPHEFLVTEDQFVKAGARLISEIGAEAYIRAILTNLKGIPPVSGTKSKEVQ